MDDSPIAQLLAHADRVEAAHLQVVEASHQLAAQAEANRPGREPRDGGQAAAGTQ